MRSTIQHILNIVVCRPGWRPSATQNGLRDAVTPRPSIRVGGRDAIEQAVKVRIRRGEEWYRDSVFFECFCLALPNVRDRCSTRINGYKEERGGILDVNHERLVLAQLQKYEEKRRWLR